MKYLKYCISIIFLDMFLYSVEEVVTVVIATAKNALFLLTRCTFINNEIFCLCAAICQ